MAELESLPYRLRIGVTGHRKLDDSAQVRATVEKALATEIDGLFPQKSRAAIDKIRREGTTPICYKVLSPLADGADRIVAEAVLAQPLARLEAILPLAIEDYLETFESDQSRAEFLELLKLARRPILLRTRRLHEDRHDHAGQTELRHQAYVQVGQYVVDHCDVLIAIWDGKPVRGVGGTADVVQYAIEQKRPIIRIWGDSIELLNKANNNGLDPSPLQAIDHFNRLPISAHTRTNYVRNLDRSYFEKPETAQGIPASVRDLVNLRLFPYYAIASTVAKENQNRFHRAGKYVYMLSAAAVGCAAFGVLVPPKVGLLGFGLELVILIVMWLTLLQAHRTHAQQNWIEYRFLAEHLRCAVFMAICGVEPKPFEVLPYLGHSQTVNDWTVRAFDEIWDRLPPLTGCSQNDCLMLNSYLREAWIGDQIEFHRKKVKLEGKARERLAHVGEVILPTTIVAAALHIVSVLWKPAGAPEAIRIVYDAFHQGLSFMALLFPAIAASLAGMESHREHLRLEKSSANMAAQLERVQRQMKPATDPERLEDLIHQATEIMLGETQSWLMLMRFVEIKA